MKSGLGFGSPGRRPLSDEDEDQRIAKAKTEANRKKMFEAESAGYEKDLKGYWKKVDAIEDRAKRVRQMREEDPFFQLERRKKMEEWREKVGEIYTAKPEFAAFAEDLKHKAENNPNNTPTDQYSRLGLMSAMPRLQAPSNDKKQVEHLQAIKDILKQINDAIRNGRVTAASTPFAN